MAKDIKRMRFFNGLFLTEEEFNLEQNYHQRMRGMHNSSLHGWGIVEGLTVEPGPGKKITVKKGIALDNIELDGQITGREIVLIDDVEKDLSSFSDKNVFVTIVYKETECDIYPDKGGEKNIHIWEQAVIEIVVDDASFGTKGKIVLAKVNVPASGSCTIVEDYKPRYAGVDVKQIRAGEILLHDDKNCETYGLLYGNDKSIKIKAECIEIKGLATIDNGMHIGGTSKPAPGGLIVEGNSSFKGDTEIGTAASKADVTVNGDIAVTGDSTVAGSSRVDGNLSVKGLMAVDGNSTITGVSSVSGSLYVQGPMVVNGNSTLTGATSVNGSLSVNGPITQTGDSIVSGDLCVVRNAGIGTTTPLARLHVKDGDIRIENGNLVVGRDVEISGNLKVKGDTIALDLQHQVGNMLLGDNDDDKIEIQGKLSSKNSTGHLEINDSVHITEKLQVDRQIGIGVETPDSAIHVRNQNVHIENGNLNIDQGASRVHLSPLDACSINTPYNVGIGTGSPTEKLHICGGNLKVQNREQETKININDRAYLGVNRHQDGMLALSKNQSTLSPVSVFINSNGSSFLNGGNVGIGQSNPAARLDIGGSLRVNGGTTFGKIVSGSKPVIPQWDMRSRTQVERVNFPTAFSRIPRVVLTVHSDSNDIIVAQTRSIRTDSFDVLLYCVNGPLIAAPIALDWLAWVEETIYPVNGDYDYIGIGGDLL